MKKAIVSLLVFSPVLAFAQQPNLTYGTSLLTQIKQLVNLALPIVVGIAMLVFFWGIVQFVIGGEEGREKGKQHMIWGIIGLFVMVAVWGIVGLLANISGVNQSATAPSVSIPTVNNSL